MQELPSDLVTLLKEQHGLASRTQLTTAGLSRGALQWRLGRSWRAVLPGMVVTFTGVLDPVQQLIAAQLYAGPEAVISSWTAAGWHGVEAARRSPIIRLTLPDRLHARSTGTVIVTRTKTACWVSAAWLCSVSLHG
jgi:hypothetical protein